MREVSYNSSAFFANGELPYFVGGPWDLAAFDAVKGLRYGVAPQPYFAGGKVVTPTDSEAIGINPASTQQAAARTFIAFMCLTAQGANAASINDPLPPVQKGALGLFEQRLKAQGHGDAVAIMSYVIAHTAIHRPRTVAYVDFETIMDNAFTDIKDGAPVAARLQQASQQLTRAFQKYQGS
jgi:multiple sugar transport system substrate-binding protein